MLYQTSRPHRLKKTSSSSQNVTNNIKVACLETKEKIVNLLTKNHDEQKSISSHQPNTQGRDFDTWGLPLGQEFEVAPILEDRDNLEISCCTKDL